MDINCAELERLAIAAQNDNGDYVALNDYGMAMPPAVCLALIAEKKALRKAVEQALLAMKRVYQAGYDRIIDAGGTCDTPEYMMGSDPTARELRALLDAPTDPKPTGLSQGWNLTRKPDGFVVGHQSVAYPPDDKAIERAERDGYVWVPFLVPAAQPQGEPVAWTYCPECGCEEIHHQQGRHKQCAECYQEWFSDLDYSDVVRGHLKKLKAEQPTPVAEIVSAQWCEVCDKVAPHRLRCDDCKPEPVALVRCSFCDAVGESGNPWTGHNESVDGKLVYRVMGCKDHKHLVDAIQAGEREPVATGFKVADFAGFNIIEDPTMQPDSLRMCNCNQGRLPCTCKPSYDGFDNSSD